MPSHIMTVIRVHQLTFAVFGVSNAELNTTGVIIMLKIMVSQRDQGIDTTPVGSLG